MKRVFTAMLAGIVVGWMTGGLSVSGGAAAQEAGGFLGLEIQPLNLASAQALNFQGSGIYIRAVEPGHAADRAGLRPSDILIRFDGANIYSMPQVIGYARSARTGEQIPVTVMRAGETLNVAVVPDSWPESWPDDRRVGARSAIYGVRLSDVRTEDSTRTGPRRWGTRGAEVVSVDPQGAMAQAGVRAGDVLRAVGGRYVNGPATFEKQAGDAGAGRAFVALTIDRGGLYDVAALPMDGADALPSPPRVLDVSDGRIAQLQGDWTSAFGLDAAALGAGTGWLVLQADMGGDLHAQGLVAGDVLAGKRAANTLRVSKLWRAGKAVPLNPAGVAGKGTVSIALEGPSAGSDRSGAFDLFGIRFDWRARAGSASRAGGGLVVAEDNQGWARGEVLLRLNQTRISTPEAAWEVVDAAKSAGRRAVLALVDTPAGHRMRMLSLDATNMGPNMTGNQAPMVGLPGLVLE